MPDFNFFGPWGFHSVKGNQTDETSRVKRRLYQSVSHHWSNKRANWLIDAGLTVIRLCENLHEPVLVRLAYLLKVVPPIVCIVEELLDSLCLKFPLQTCLAFDDLFCQQFLPRERRAEVNVHS